MGQISHCIASSNQNHALTLKVPEKLQLYGLYVYYVVHICNFGMLRVNDAILVIACTAV